MPGDKARALMISGIAGIALGAALHAAGICPIVKRIWTPSWTIFSAGWVALILAAYYYVIDVKGFRRWTFPLVVVGMNSIAMYVFEHVTTDYIENAWRIHIGRRVFEIFGPAFAPITTGAAALATMWLMLLWMYRRRIFLRL
jgi:predicted acyltransferase